jgi:drug/metabolite transporter (DMT)-like permease
VLLGQQVAGALIVGAVIVASAEDPPDARAIWLSLLAGATGALALGAFYRALAIGTMSVIAPITSSGVIVPVVVGVASGDRPSAVQAMAIPVIFAGVVLASRERAEQPRPAAARASVLLALLAALSFGVYFSITDAVADDSVLWLLLLGRAAAIVPLIALVTARPPPTRPTGRDLLALAAIGALDLLATGLYALATTKGLLSIVAVVGVLYPVTTVLLARAVLGERLHRAQQAGVGLAFAGVAAVAAG